MLTEECLGYIKLIVVEPHYGLFFQRTHGKLLWTATASASRISATRVRKGFLLYPSLYKLLALPSSTALGTEQRALLLAYLVREGLAPFPLGLLTL